MRNLLALGLLGGSLLVPAEPAQAQRWRGGPWAGYYRPYGWAYGSPGYYRGYAYPGYAYSPWYSSYYAYPSATYVYPSYSSYYVAPYTSAAPYTYSPSPSSYDSRAYSVGPAVATVTPSANTAVVEVRLPDPDAKVWFNGQKMQQRGPVRTFTTPPLNGGMYAYDITAAWTQNGRVLTQERNVMLRAGESVRVDFTQAALLPPPRVGSPQPN